MSDLLVIGLSGWIIQDGNYGDFGRGRRAAFALEFDPLSELREPKIASAPERSLIHLGDARYNAVGQVVHVADDWWVIDFGVLAYEDQKPPENVRSGGWLCGQIGLGIDPFFYFDGRAHEPQAPALIYDWDIEKIEMQTAPASEMRPRLFRRGSIRFGWTEIAKTEAWKDGGGLADYILHCRRLDRPARRELKAS